jgi:hypothetical protein
MATKLAHAMRAGIAVEMHEWARRSSAQPATRRTEERLVQRAPAL